MDKGSWNHGYDFKFLQIDNYKKWGIQTNPKGALIFIKMKGRKNQLRKLRKSSERSGRARILSQNNTSGRNPKIALPHISSPWSPKFRTRTPFYVIPPQSIQNSVRMIITVFNYVFVYKPHRILVPQKQFHCSVMSDSLQPHGLQHTRFPCPSPTPGACANSCPSSLWCHLTISSSVIPFSSSLQSFQASGSFQMSQFFTSDGQNIGGSASASVLPMNIQDWFPLGWTGWISLQSKGLSRVFSSTTVQKHQFFGTQLSLESNSHIHTWLLEKIIALTRWTFVGKVISLLFNMLSRLVTAFFPRSKCLLISWLQSPSAMILEPKKIKSDTVSIVSPTICHEVMGPDAMILVFWMFSFKLTYHSPLSLSSRGSLFLIGFLP